MPPVGDILREARERKGVTLLRAAAATRIQERFLVAFEQDDYASLPGGVYTKGLLHNYAEYLELDADEIVKMYGMAPASRRREKITVEPATKPLEPSAKYAPSFALVLFVVILAAALFAWSYSAFFVAGNVTPTPVAFIPTPTPSEVVTTPTEAPTLPPPTETPVTTPTTTATPSATPTPELYTEIELTIEALQPAWVLVRADGKQIANATLPAGTVATYVATESISIWCGNSDYVEVTLSGQEMGRLGEPGQDIVKTAWRLENGKIETTDY